jgi:hypothetical protein
MRPVGRKRLRDRQGLHTSQQLTLGVSIYSTSPE